MAAASDEDIGGLDVSMDDALRVCCIQSVGHINGKDQQEFEVHGPAGDRVLQRLAVEEFHGNKSFAVVFPNVVNGADARMIQRGRRLGFAAEAFERLGIVGHVVWKEFEGDKTLEAGVFGFVHHAHTPTAKFFENFIMRKGLPGGRLAVGHGSGHLTVQPERSQCNAAKPSSPLHSIRRFGSKDVLLDSLGGRHLDS